MCLPDGWNTISREALAQRGVEMPEEVLVVFESETAAAGQFPHISITQENLARPMESAAYSDENIRLVSVLPGYESFDKRAVTIDSTELLLHVFALKPETDQPSQRFYQLSTTNGSVGYTITAMTPFSYEKSRDRELVDIFESFTFESKETEE
jgi:hypothetical protein